MLLPVTFLTYIKLVEFVYEITLSAGSDLKSVILLYDKDDADLASAILREIPNTVLWSVINLNAPDYNKLLKVNRSETVKKFEHGYTITLAVLKKNVFFELSRIYKEYKILTKGDSRVMLIYQNFVSLFHTQRLLKTLVVLSLIIVNPSVDGINVFVWDPALERAIEFSDSEFTIDRRNQYFFHIYRNMNRAEFDVMVLLDPPYQFNTSITVINDNNGLPERKYAIGGVNIYLTQLVAEKLNGTAVYKVNNPLLYNVTSPKMLKYINNKMKLPLKAPVLEPVVEFELLGKQQFNG